MFLDMLGGHNGLEIVEIIFQYISFSPSSLMLPLDCLKFRSDKALKYTACQTILASHEALLLNCPVHEMNIDYGEQQTKGRWEPNRKQGYRLRVLLEFLVSLVIMMSF